MKTKFKFILVGLNFIFSLNFSSAQEINSFSIEEAKAYALENHLSVKNAGNDILIARQQYVEIRGMGLPQIGINGSFNNFINLPVQVIDAKFLNPNAPDGETFTFKAGTEYSSSGTLQVDQLIFNGSYIVGLQVAKLYATFQEDLEKQTKEDIAFNVIQAYELASVAKTNKAFLDSLVVITEDLIEKQRNFFELELILKEDMDQLSYSLLKAKSSQTTADIQYQNSVYLLKYSMGFPMSDPIELKDSPNVLLKKSALGNGDIHNNISITILDKQVQLSEYSLKDKKFANLPSLNAYFQQTYNAYRNEFNFFANEKWFPQTVWGLQLNVPIFSGLSRHARTSQAKIQLMKDQNSYTLMEQSLEYRELQYRNNLRGAENVHELQKENVALARTIYDNAIIVEKIGKGNSLIVTQKHNQLMVAQSQYIGSLVDLFQARLNLDKLYNNILMNN